MSKLRDKIESIIISEVDKLYEKAAHGGLTVEDIRKLEVLVKIKDLENISGSEEKKDEQRQRAGSVEELMRRLKDGDYRSE